MAIILKQGDRKKVYEIVRELNRGAFAIAYEAKSPSEGKVFFKQYKAPSKLVDWYQGFIEHQQELKARVSTDLAVKELCYRFIEFFEDPAGFYQVFEFIEGGKTLDDCIANPSAYSWEDLVVFAKIMMLGVKGLHNARVVHTDLKPENIILIPDASITRKYRLRLIDMDWSIFTDRKAPWDGREGYGYVGTPGYQSPEHVSGKVPTTASDVFTCGIMLGQALGGQHPFKDAEDYNQAILRGHFQPIKLKAAIPKAENQDFIEAILNSCLDPNPAKRPTAEQVCNALLGDVFAWDYVPTTHKEEVKVDVVKPTTPSSTPAPKPTPTPPKVVASAIQILFDGMKVAEANVETDFGKQLFKGLHEDAQFLSNPQFKLKKQGTQWVIEHAASATNETIVDGKKLTGTVPVVNGMRVSVGNSSKGIEKFPLTLKLSS